MVSMTRRGNLQWPTSFAGTLLPVRSVESTCPRRVDRTAEPGATPSESGCGKTGAFAAGGNDLDQAVRSVGQVKKTAGLRKIDT